MIRLNIVVEGRSEQNFVNNVLSDHLSIKKIFPTSRCVYTSREGHYWHRGGLVDYKKLKQDILIWIKQEKRNENVYFSTMIDLYRLPVNFPRYEEASRKTDPYERVRILEDAFADDINFFRFIPYIQLHEFESLIFADPEKLKLKYLNHDGPIQGLMDIVANEVNPEEINDGVDTAPSKRIKKLIPEYAKSTDGPLVLKEIGVNTLRNRCRHFGDWLSRLENLQTQNDSIS